VKWMRRVLIGLAAGLSLLGCYLSTQMLVQHTMGQSAGGLLQAICSASRGGCDKVSSSRWSVIPPRPKDEAEAGVGTAGSPAPPPSLHIPIPVFGLFYFSALAAWFIGIGCPNELGRRWQLVPFLATLAGNAGSACFLYIMAKVIKAWCAGCLAIHAINLLLLMIVIATCVIRRRQAAAMRPGTAPADALVPHPSARLALVTMTLAVSLWLIGGMLAVSLVFYTQALASTSVVKEVSEDADILAMMYAKREKHDIPIRPDDPWRGGPANAPATLVVFADMTCPDCRRFEKLMTSQIQPLFGEQMRVVFKHYALSSECNPPFETKRSSHSCPAAYAMEAARLQGGNEAFWRMHDEIRRHSDDMASMDYRAAAVQFGLDPDRLAADMRDPSVRARVEEDGRLAYELKVKGPPAIFLNGRQVPPVALSPEAQKKMLFWKRMAETLISGGSADSATAGRLLPPRGHPRP
jgi:protein-disulfide isomerase